MIFWKRDKKGSESDQVSDRLLRLVREHLTGADEETTQIVTATAGLLACVAFADRQLTAQEREHLCVLLQRVHGITDAGPGAICDMLQVHMPELALVNSQAYTRILRELADRDLRLEVLDVLVDLAVSDSELSFEETQLLRRLTSALGLEQQDYNDAQARHLRRLEQAKG